MLHADLNISFFINFSFPCTVGDCKKEYRTQWELNSHFRLKHSKQESESTNETNDEYISQTECDGIDFELSASNAMPSCRIEIQSVEELGPKRKYALVSSKKDQSTPKKKVKRIQQQQQQIIYVMPGPTTEHVITHLSMIIATMYTFFVIVIVLYLGHVE